MSWTCLPLLASCVRSSWSGRTGTGRSPASTPCQRKRDLRERVGEARHGREVGLGRGAALARLEVEDLGRAAVDREIAVGAVERQVPRRVAGGERVAWRRRGEGGLHQRRRQADSIALDAAPADGQAVTDGGRGRRRRRSPPGCAGWPRGVARGRPARAVAGSAPRSGGRGRARRGWARDGRSSRRPPSVAGGEPGRRHAPRERAHRACHPALPRAGPPCARGPPYGCAPMTSRPRSAAPAPSAASPTSRSPRTTCSDPRCRSAGPVEHEQRALRFVVVRDRVTPSRRCSAGGGYAGAGHLAGAAAGIALVGTQPDADLDLGQALAYLQLAARARDYGSCIASMWEPDRAKAILGIPPDLRSPPRCRSDARPPRRSRRGRRGPGPPPAARGGRPLGALGLIRRTTRPSPASGTGATAARGQSAHVGLVRARRRAPRLERRRVEPTGDCQVCHQRRARGALGLEVPGPHPAALGEVGGECPRRSPPSAPPPHPARPGRRVPGDEDARPRRGPPAAGSGRRQPGSRHPSPTREP